MLPEGEEEGIRLLSRMEIMEPLSRRELEELSRRTPALRIERNTLFLTPEYGGQMLFLLLEGRVRLYKMWGGREVTLDVLESGALFWEASLTSRRLQDLYAQAVEASTVLLVSRAAFERLVASNPGFGLKVIEHLTGRTRLG